MKMKSQICSTAWQLVKFFGMSRSEALQIAWKSYKNNVEIRMNTSFNGKKIISYSRGDVTMGSIESLLIYLAIRVPVSNDGASAWYDGKTFNND